MEASHNKGIASYGIDVKAPQSESPAESIKIEEGEVFSARADGVDFRTLGWIRGRPLPMRTLERNANPDANDSCHVLH
jgi:hypothetical protein